MQGLPDIRTIDDWLDGDSAERHPQSETMIAHNKGQLIIIVSSFTESQELQLKHLPLAADGGERRQELYLIENIRHGFTMED